MNSVIPSDPPVAPGGRRDRRWRLALITSFALVAAALVTHFVRTPPSVSEGTAYTGLLATFALIYLTGFLRYFPDAIGGNPATRHGDEDQRWRKYLRVPCGVLLGWGLWSGLAELASGVPRVRESLLVCAYGAGWLFLAFVMSSILGRALGTAGAGAVIGQGPMRRRGPVEWAASRLSPRVSLSLGSLLVLLTLVATTSADFGCGTTYYRGHEIVHRRGAWITAENTRASGLQARIVAEVGWVMYLMALALAATTLVLVARWRIPRIDARRLRWLQGTSAVIVLCTLSDLSFWPIHGVDWMEHYVVPAWLLTGLVPPLLWARHVRSRTAGLPDGWRRFRTCLVILWLPVACAAYFFCAFTGFFVYGYALHFFGIQLLWWGYLGLANQVEKPSSAEVANGHG